MFCKLLGSSLSYECFFNDCCLCLDFEGFRYVKSKLRLAPFSFSLVVTHFRGLYPLGLKTHFVIPFAVESSAVPVHSGFAHRRYQHQHDGPLNVVLGCLVGDIYALDRQGKLDRCIQGNRDTSHVESVRFCA